MRLCNERRERVYFIMARVPRQVPLTPPVYNDRREKTGNVCLYTILLVVKSLPAVWLARMFQRARIHAGSISALPARLFLRSGTLITFNHCPLNSVTTLVVVTKMAVFDTPQEPLVPV